MCGAYYGNWQIFILNCNWNCLARARAHYVDTWNFLCDIVVVKKTGNRYCFPCCLYRLKKNFFVLIDVSATNKQTKKKQIIPINAISIYIIDSLLALEMHVHWLSLVSVWKIITYPNETNVQCALFIIIINIYCFFCRFVTLQSRWIECVVNNSLALRCCCLAAANGAKSMRITCYACTHTFRIEPCMHDVSNIWINLTIEMRERTVYCFIQIFIAHQIYGFYSFIQLVP